jgi:hypothetical protein
LKNNEKNRAYAKVLEQILATQAALINKQKEAATETNVNKKRLAENRMGYLNNFRLGLMRGGYALKPLSGVVGRKMTARSPNRPQPGKGKNVIFNEPLKKPHIVVTGGLHINPGTLIGFIKSFTGANIKPADLKYWLRWMRKDFPNKTLFRHLRKDIKPGNVRFSKA